MSALVFPARFLHSTAAFLLGKHPKKDYDYNIL